MLYHHVAEAGTECLCKTMNLSCCCFIGPLYTLSLRGSFFLENGTLRDTREKNPEIGSKNVTD